MTTGTKGLMGRMTVGDFFFRARLPEVGEALEAWKAVEVSRVFGPDIPNLNLVAHEHAADDLASHEFNLGFAWVEGQPVGTTTEGDIRKKLLKMGHRLPTFRQACALRRLQKVEVNRIEIIANLPLRKRAIGRDHHFAGEHVCFVPLGTTVETGDGKDSCLLVIGKNGGEDIKVFLHKRTPEVLPQTFIFPIVVG